MELGGSTQDNSQFDDLLVAELKAYARVLSVVLGYRDSLTQYHCARVQGLALELGTLCGLDKRQLSELYIAALFHDIGKVGIPDTVLLKSDALDAEEWNTMKMHSEIGQKIMIATDLEDAKAIATLIRHHHEHFDGGGYPDQLRSNQIPLASRIISIADSYDAMASTRSYHRSRRHQEIVNILQTETGTKHDPSLMQVFVKMIEQSSYKIL